MIDVFLFFVNNVVLVISLIIFGTYTGLAIVSASNLLRYFRKNSYVDYKAILLYPELPTVSILVPAFNEEKSVVDSLKALMSLYYTNYEVVMVNDGSTDKTLEHVIEAFELEKVNYAFDYRLPCQRIRGVYKSKRRNFARITVIDKINGGKSDSLNAGLNVSHSRLVVCLDADSIIEPDTLLKLVKPFLEEESGRKVIGAGGVIRIANQCEIENGELKQVHLPKKFLPRIQILEYTRAFIMARMAWAKIDGLLIISGALGMFDKEILIASGGYRTDTVGEDMEVVVRMRRYMSDRRQKYSVACIPDPLCWTEVPETFQSLSRQRNRWTRGLAETLWFHKKMFLNPKYGRIGMLSYPYWLLFEWAAPLIEFLGYVYFTYLIITGSVNWPFFALLLLFVYNYAVMLSLWAIFFEEMTYHRYNKRSDVLKLALTAMLEPILYHPFTVFWAVKANIDFLLGKSDWGKQERIGFKAKRKKEINVNSTNTKESIVEPEAISSN